MIEQKKLYKRFKDDFINGNTYPKRCDVDGLNEHNKNLGILRELLENRDRVEQLRFTASVVGELIARNQIELVLGSDAAWKMIRELAEERCFQALREIRNVLDDSGLTDPECFAEIEKIISVLEELGVGCGRRHDF